MTITWLGHSCFRIEAKEGSILIDPFSKELGLRPPKVKEDILLVTHRHFDHAGGATDVGPDTFVIDGPGEYERRGIQVRGIQSFHDTVQGLERGLNTMYVIVAEDMTVCHLGDLGEQKLTDRQLEEIGDVDILMVPVGGKYTIGPKEAVAVVSQIQPKVVIPMHFKEQGITIEGLEGVEKFVKEIGLTPEKVEKFRVAKKTLPVEETKLVLFTS